MRDAAGLPNGRQSPECDVAKRLLVARSLRDAPVRRFGDLAVGGARAQVLTMDANQARAPSELVVTSIVECSIESTCQPLSKLDSMSNFGDTDTTSCTPFAGSVSP